MKRHYPASRKFAPGFLPRFSNGIVRHISAAAAVVLLSFHAAAVEFRWVASAQDIAPVDRAIYQGETLDLTATMTSYGRPVVFPDGAVATFLWRPLGADAPYFDKPASVEINGSRLMARFTPDDDIGESAYEFFIRAQVDSSVNYRANGIIRTLDSPGFSPGTLTPPIPYLDFATIIYTNAPWLLASDLPEPPDLSPYATTDDLAAVWGIATSAQDAAVIADGNAMAANVAAVAASNLAASAQAQIGALPTKAWVNQSQGHSPQDWFTWTDNGDGTATITGTTGNAPASGTAAVCFPPFVDGLKVTGVSWNAGSGTPSTNPFLPIPVSLLRGDELVTGGGSFRFLKVVDGGWIVFPRLTQSVLHQYGNPGFLQGSVVNIFAPSSTVASWGAPVASQPTPTLNVYFGNSRPSVGGATVPSGWAFYYPRGTWADVSPVLGITPRPYDPEPWMLQHVGTAGIQKQIDNLGVSGIAAATTINYTTGTLSVTVPNNGTLSVNTTNWPEGMAAAVSAIIDTPATFSFSPAVAWTAAGYSVIPDNSVSQCVFWRIGTNIFYNVLYTQPK